MAWVRTDGRRGSGASGGQGAFSSAHGYRGRSWRRWIRPPERWTWIVRHFCARLWRKKSGKSANELPAGNHPSLNAAVEFTENLKVAAILNARNGMGQWKRRTGTIRLISMDKKAQNILTGFFVLEIRLRNERGLIGSGTTCENVWLASWNRRHRFRIKAPL